MSAGTETETTEKPCLLAYSPWLVQLGIYATYDRLPKDGTAYYR